jgi:MFS family permease
MQTVPFWGCFFMWMLGVTAYQIVTTHQMAHVLDKGIDPDTAVWIFGMAGVFTTGGNVLGGALSDRWGREWVFGFGSLLTVLGIAFFSYLTGPDDVLKLMVFAVVFGIGSGMRISQLAVIPADLFYGKNFGTIFGFLNGGGGIGGFIGPPFAGFLYDRTGSYRFAFSVSAAAVIGSAIAVWIAAPRKARGIRNA